MAVIYSSVDSLLGQGVNRGRLLLASKHGFYNVYFKYVCSPLSLAHAQLRCMEIWVLKSLLLSIQLRQRSHRKLSLLAAFTFVPLDPSIAPQEP